MKEAIFGPLSSTLTLSVLLVGLAACSATNEQHQQIQVPASAAGAADSASLDLSTLAKIATVDERFQSFNVEMVEVTGGRFWAPYDAGTEDPEAPKSGVPGVVGDGTSLGVDGDKVFRYRPPLDLSHSRLRKLAGALVPAYMRVSGSWANFTYFHASDEPVPAEPPEGFDGILTQAQWRGVVDASKNLGLDILVSFAISDGTRDANGVWQPEQAKALFDATSATGGKIAAVEFMNETTIGRMQGLAEDYTAEDYARDFLAFKALVDDVSPHTLIAGPSAVAEQQPDAMKKMGIGLIKTEDIFNITGPVVDAVSYHYYGGVSQRCAKSMGQPLPDASRALEPQWLAGTGYSADFYGKLRDKLEPGKPLWLTETAEAACGGNPWAATFIDSFRYIDQLGRLAKRSVQTVMHNTLAASDYAMLDEGSFTPRPNYWAALLWRRLMGEVVLDSGKQPNPATFLYAHCLRGVPGGVAVVALNVDRENATSLALPGIAERYTLSAEGSLETETVLLNGEVLALDDDGNLPQLAGARVATNRIELLSASISFLAAPGVNNPACR